MSKFNSEELVNFRSKLTKFLEENTTLSKIEIGVATNFLSGLLIVGDYRVPVLRIMQKALELMEDVVDGKITLGKADFGFKTKILN